MKITSIYKLAITLCLSLTVNTAYCDTPTGFPADLPSDAEMQALGKKAMGDAGKMLEQTDKVISVSPAAKIDTSENNPAFKQAPSGKDLAQEVMAMKPPSTAAPQPPKYELIIFVSFSMPDDTLRAYSLQAKESGATIVLRGLHEESIPKTQMRAYQVNPGRADWEITPALFKKFKVETVPAIVLTDTANGSVLENGCAKEGDYLKVGGDISVRQALLTMRRYGDGALKNVAASMLATLESSK